MDIFQALYDFFNIEIYTIIKDVFVWLGYKIIVWKVTTIIFMVDVSWSIVQLIIDDLQLAAHLSDALSMIPADIRSKLDFFNVFTGLQWIFQALATKFVFKFLGF